MRPQSPLRAAPAIALAGALGIAISTAVAAPATAAPTLAGATTCTATDAASCDPAHQGIHASLQDATLRFDEAVRVAGAIASGQPGLPVRLEFRAAGEAGWTALREAATGAGGQFAFRVQLRRSGALRVVQPAAVAQAATAGGAALAAPPAAASVERPVRVAARIVTTRVHRHVATGRALRVRGAVRPAGPGRTVELQLRRDGRWRTVDRDRTNAAGRFRLDERLAAATSTTARVRFAGDASNGATRRGIGRVNAYRMAFASWYGPGLYGNPLGCGGRLTGATIGVAHKTLPCGTALTLRYRGRTVRARVVDRGPFVGGREFDLTAATKARLGFGSTGWIQVSR